MTHPIADICQLPPRMLCSKCGVSARAACDCGAGYTPKPTLDRAVAAIRETPELSNMLIAKRVGCDEKTVRKARKHLYSDCQSEQVRSCEVRKRSDGRMYIVPARVAAPAIDPAAERAPETATPAPAPAARKRKTAAGMEHDGKLYKRRKTAHHYKAPVTVKDHVIAFTRELSQFAMHYSLELVKWLDTNPEMEPEGRDALAHSLEAYSLQLQRLAQRVDGR